MHIAEAQADVRRSFVDGGPGQLVSGLVWFVSAIAASKGGIRVGFAVLFFGGMLIFPLTLVTTRAVFHRARTQDANALIPIALESTAAMIAGLFGAYLLVGRSPDLVFPLSTLVVGTHYFSFRTLYGDATFLILGAVISVLGLNAIFHWLMLPGGVLWWIAGIEIVFGVYLTVRNLRR